VHNKSGRSYNPYLGYGTTYYWSITAWDNHGESNKSEIWSFTTEDIEIGANNPPSKPVVEGPSTGHKNTTYEFTAVSFDADNDTLQYIFTWGDGVITSTEFLQEGLSTLQAHKWTDYGEYTISVEAFDGEHRSEPTNMTILIDAVPINNDVAGFLVDIDGDGIYDFFVNTETGLQTSVVKENDTYLIDNDGDGTWDHAYNPDTGLITYYEYVYLKYIPIITQETPGFELLLLVAGMVLAVIALRRKREHKKEGMI
jgi:hypothetical protein